MALEKNLEKIDKLLSLMDSESLTKEMFLNEFEKVVNIILRIQKEQADAIERLETTYNNLIRAIRNEHGTSLSDLKGQVDNLFVGNQLKRMNTETQTNFNNLKQTINSFVDERLSRIKDGAKGDRGPTGIGERGPMPTTQDIGVALAPTVEEFKRNWEGKVDEVLRRRGGVRGLGGASVITPRTLMSISTDTTPAITGAINGSNTAYVLPKPPTSSRGRPFGVAVFLNAARMREGSSNDYTVAGRTLTFNTAPLTDDVLVCDISY